MDLVGRCPSAPLCEISPAFRPQQNVGRRPDRCKTRVVLPCALFDLRGLGRRSGGGEKKLGTVKKFFIIVGDVRSPERFFFVLIRCYVLRAPLGLLDFSFRCQTGGVILRLLVPFCFLVFEYANGLCLQEGLQR